MKKKEVLLVLTERWADWEASYAIAGINSTQQYDVKTIAIDQYPKVSIGGLRVEIDYSIEDYQCFDHLAMIILPGGYSWKENNVDKIADFVRDAHDFGIPIAAICGATIFLAKHGLLDNVKHTGDEWQYFESVLKDQEKYHGHDNFVSAQIVSHNGFITANETAAVDFAYEIFRTLELHTNEELEIWHDTFKNGMIR